MKTNESSSKVINSLRANLAASVIVLVLVNIVVVLLAILKYKSIVRLHSEIF